MIVFGRLRRRSIVLIEVLIAFALVALCVLPLIYPHVFILRSEKKFISTVELDHFVNLLYANRLEKLYQNEISWSDIDSGKGLPIDSSILESMNYTKDLPFVGTYKFIHIKHKPNKPINNVVYLYNMEFTFTPKNTLFLEKQAKTEHEMEQQKITYKYQIAIERKSYFNKEKP